jgi:hypothetical protein
MTEKSLVNDVAVMVGAVVPAGAVVDDVVDFELPQATKPIVAATAVESAPARLTNVLIPVPFRPLVRIGGNAKQPVRNKV